MSGGREIWHQRCARPTTLMLNRDTISGIPFRDDQVSVAGIQTPGRVLWRLQLNDEVVETTLEEIEQVLSAQLEHVRDVMGQLARLPRQRTG